MSKTPDTLEKPHLYPTFEVGPFAEFNSRNLMTAMQVGAATMKGTTAYWGHLGDFAGRRLKADAEIATTLSTCRNGEEAARTQHRFVSTMIADYFNEMHALLSISADIAKGIAEPLESRAEEAIQAMESREAAA